MCKCVCVRVYACVQSEKERERERENASARAGPESSKEKLSSRVRNWKSEGAPLEEDKYMGGSWRYKGFSPIRKRPPPYEPLRTLGVGLR